MIKELAGGDRRSIGKADQVVARVFKTPALLDEVICGIGHDDAVIRMRCADVAEKVSAVRPEWLQRHKRDLLLLAAKFRDKGSSMAYSPDASPFAAIAKREKKGHRVTARISLRRQPDRKDVQHASAVRYVSNGCQSKGNGGTDSPERS